MSSRLLLLLVVVVIGGCGFQLQTAVSTPQAMQQTYIAAADRHTHFYRELRSRLQMAGVDVVDQPAAGAATLSILSDETGQRVLSVSARNVPTEFEVYYSVEYALASGSQSLLEPQFVTLTRDYTYDETRVLGKSREEELLREAIVSDLVRTVLRRLSTL